MASEMDSVNEKAPSAPFNSERLYSMVLDHVLDNMSIFIGDGPGAADKLVKLMDSLNVLTEKVALEAVANRVHLQALPTYNSKIHPDPNHDLNDDRLYEMRFRLVEQVGDDKPCRDDVMTKTQARDKFGDAFVEEYWGGLGERCPNSVTTGSRTLWFSAVRYPVDGQAMTQTNQDSEKKSYRAPSLG
jgi:hypothetical protein